MGPSIENIATTRHLLNSNGNLGSGTLIERSPQQSSILGPNYTDAVTATTLSVEKAQWIRLLDAFVIGPAIIYYGRQADSKLGRTFMTAIGIGTIAYNGANYLANKKIQNRKVNHG